MIVRISSRHYISQIEVLLIDKLSRPIKNSAVILLQFLEKNYGLNYGQLLTANFGPNSQPLT